MNDGNVANYLNNHLAGSIAGLELVKRAATENRGSDLGEWLEKLHEEMEEDRDMVRRILRALGKTEDTIKKLGGWAFEKMAATRLSDFAGGSPHLRRVVELEGLFVGTQGRLGMWRLLEGLCGADARLAFADFPRLRRRAEEQARELDRLREAEAKAAFTE